MLKQRTYSRLSRSWYVLLFLFIWSLHCLSFFDLRLLIIRLISSNFSDMHVIFTPSLLKCNWHFPILVIIPICIGIYYCKLVHFVCSFFEMILLFSSKENRIKSRLYIHVIKLLCSRLILTLEKKHPIRTSYQINTSFWLDEFGS